MGLSRRVTIQNCHHFHKTTQSTLGGGGQWPLYAFKNVDYDALPFHKVSLKINIFKVSFWRKGGGHKKEFSVYAFDNVDNYGRSLT